MLDHDHGLLSLPFFMYRTLISEPHASLVIAFSWGRDIEMHLGRYNGSIHPRWYG